MKKFLFLVLFVLFFSPFANALTVNSIDSVSIQSNSAELSGKQWVLEVTLDQLDDKIIGSISAENIDAPTGEQAKNNLEIDASVNSRSCDYSIQRQESIYRFEVVDMSSDWNPLDDQSECFEDSNAYKYIKPNNRWHGLCIVKKQLAHQGNLVFGRKNFDATFKVTADGETANLNINSETSPDGDLIANGQKIGHANWLGNLGSGEECPAPLDQNLITVQPIGQGWLTSDKINFDNYKSSFSNGFNICINTQVIKDDRNDLTEQEVQDCVNQHNSKAQSTLASKNLRNRQGDIAVISGDQVKLSLSKPIIFPSLRLRLKADWLGIFIPTGEPEIVSLSSVEFKEGSVIGEIDALVKNKGTAEGSFSLSAQCQEPFSFDENVLVFNLDANQEATKTLAVNVDKNIDKTESASCTITLTERNTGKSVSKSVQVKANPLTFCDEGETQCIGERYFICNKDGQFVRNSVKDSECKTDGDDLIRPPVLEEECKPILKAGSFIIIPSFDDKPLASLDPRRLTGQTTTSCLGLVGGIAFFVGLITLILGTLLGGLFLKDLFLKTSTFAVKKKLTGVGVLLSILFPLIISFILYVLVLKLAVWGIVIGILYLVVGGIIKSVI